MNNIINRLEKEFGLTKVKRKNEKYFSVKIEKENLISFLNSLKNLYGFKTLVHITCVDWIEKSVFELVYILWNASEKIQLIVKTDLNREEPNFISIGNMWTQAAYHERELKEMFGISFDGNMIQNEEFILEDWDDMPPMRRDFDTEKYSKENYAERPGREHTNVKEYLDNMFNSSFLKYDDE